MALTDKMIIGDDDEEEFLCTHGIGHGNGVHTCDGCCVDEFNQCNVCQHYVLKKQWKNGDQCPVCLKEQVITK